MFSKLRLTNFTAFEQVDLHLSPGINIFIGPNGTGKTHLLKLLYCFQTILRPNSKNFPDKMAAVFRPKNGQLNRLARRRPGRTSTSLFAEWDGVDIIASLNSGTGLNIQLTLPLDYLTTAFPVFIPVKEMLSLAPGFISLYDKYNLEIDETYYDLLKMAYLPPKKGAPLAENKDILEIIRKLIGGQVVVEGDMFFLRHRNANMEMNLVAEGHRKLALIWQLIHNGSLFEGKTLFWDEPEANLNPYIMQHVAKILLLLAQRGIQIFIATHHYPLLKELDLQNNNTPVNYFSLYEDGKEGVKVNTCHRYQDIMPNKISEAYLRIYDLEVERALKGTT